MTVSTGLSGTQWRQEANLKLRNLLNNFPFTNVLVLERKDPRYLRGEFFKRSCPSLQHFPVQEEFL